MKSAMVLAAGLGTRLRPLTDELPKPLVPVGDRPLIAHVTDEVRRWGYDQVVVNSFHHADSLRAWAAMSSVLVSAENELLGTAGGVARARPLLGDGDVLVYNSDILAHFDLRALDAHLAGAAVLAVSPRPRGEGNVGMDGDGRVVRLRKRSVREEVSGGDFLGVHVLSRALVAELPEKGCLVGDVYIPALERGVLVTAFPVNEPFLDLGTLHSYFEANMAWLDERGGLSAHENATIDPGVRLERSILGAGARAVGHGELTECIVWPGATAVAPLSRAIVTPSRTVPV